MLTSQSPAGITYYKLRLSLSVKADILTHRLQRMEKAGYINKLGKEREAVYYATQKGLEFLKESEKIPIQNVNGFVSKTSTIPIQNVNKRDYAKLYYPLEQPVGKAALRMCLQLNRIATKEDALGQLHFKYNLTAELYNDYLMLYSPEIKRSQGADAFEANANIKKLLDEEALKIEALFRANKIPFTLQGFKDKHGSQILVSYVSKQEMAHEQHPMAEATKGGKNKIVLNYNPIDGKEETIIDASKLKAQGFKEMEAVHRITAPEVSDIIDKQLSHIEPPTQEDMQAWIEGRIKWSDIPEMKQSLKETAQLLSATANSQRVTQGQLNYYAEKIAAHSQAIDNLNLTTAMNIQTMNKLNKILDKIDRKLSQRTLREEHE